MKLGVVKKTDSKQVKCRVKEDVEEERWLEKKIKLYRKKKDDTR